MVKRIILLTFFGYLAFSLPAFKTRLPLQPLPLLTGNEIIRAPIINNPLFTISPGETCSKTFADYQQNGTLGNRLSIAGDYRAFDWMHSPDSNSTWPTRWIRYNSYYNGAFQLGLGMEVTTAMRSGYCTIGSFSDGRAICFFHMGSRVFSVAATEISAGSGLFNDPVAIDTITIPPGGTGSGTTIWPHGAVGMNDVCHVISYPSKPPGSASDFYYSRSTDQGATFSPWMPVMNDSQISTLSPDIYASPRSPKVLIAYTRKIENPNPGITTQVQQNVWFRESPDNGVTWNSPVRVTNYAWPTPGDTNPFPFAYTDVDGIYDKDGNLHLVWTEVWFADTTGRAYGSRIMHWSQATGITLVSGVGNNNAPPVITDSSIWYMPKWDAWRRPADRPQLACDYTNGNLYCVWTGNKDMNDTSASGRTNNELWLSYSTDGGATWSRYARNLTNSPSPGAQPGFCEDDDYFTLWSEVYDGKLHIQYINDKDAGGLPQNEGVATNNPVLYLQVVPISISEDKANNIRGKLFITPNPSTNYANIVFYLNQNHPVNLRISDALGRKVEEIKLSGKTGANFFTWRRPKEMKNGVYFVSLNLPSPTPTQKLILH